MSRHELIELDRVEARPWKNGAGLTRELAIEPPSAAGMDDFDWRLSVAELARDAPFSAFPGVQRCIVLLQGGGMCLRSADTQIDHRLDRAFEPYRFDGETPLQARLLDGPSTDFNVMVRRGRFSADVRPCGDTQWLDASAVALLLCWQGQVDIAPAGETAPITLRARHAVLWRDGSPALQLRPASSETRALLVRLQPLCQDGQA